MRRGRWETSATPAGGRVPRLDNLALVPASLLPYKAVYQRLANQLPAGAVLVVLSTEHTAETRTLQEAAARLRAKGHAIATLSVDDILARARRRRTAPSPAVPTVSPEPVAPPAAASPATPTDTGPEPPPAAVPPFTHELRLVRIDDSPAPARVEVWQWQPTLWGTVALVRAGGTLGTPLRLQVLLEAAAPGSEERVTRLVRRRLRAGYRIADWQ